MAFKVYLRRGGIPVAREDDQGQRLEDLPGALEGVNDDRLRWNGTAIEDAEDNTTFYINASGEKCLINDDPNAVIATGVGVDINRRGGPNDDIVRSTGSFITDGFQVGDLISVSGGHADVDKVYKILTVSALEIETDEDFSRPDSDQLGLTVTIETGYQRLDCAFGDELLLDSRGVWVVKSDAQKQTEAIAQFKIDLKAAIDQHISTTGGAYPDRRREQSEYEAAQYKIIRGSTLTVDDLLDDAWNRGQDIYNKVSASATGLTLTFDATAKTVTRSAGSWVTDGFQRTMEVTFSGTTLNNRAFTIRDVTSDTVLTISDADAADINNETATAGCEATGLATIKGYANFRGSDNPGDFPNFYAEEFMEAVVINIWFDDLRDLRRTANKNVDNSDIWAISTVYAVDDYVYDPVTDKFYVCTTGHTSGTTSLTADIANWSEYGVDGLTFAEYPTDQLAS